MRAVGIILALIILASLTAPVLGGNYDGTIYLRASSNRVKVGEEFILYVAVNTTQKVGALDIEVEYPEGLVEIKSVKCPQKGVFLEHSSQGGILKVSMVSLSGLSAGRILEVTLKSRERGIAQFGLRVIDVATPEAMSLNLRVRGGLEVLILPPQEDTSTPSPTPTATSSPTETPTTTTPPTDTETTTTRHSATSTTASSQPMTATSTTSTNSTISTTTQPPESSGENESQTPMTTTSGPKPLTTSTPETLTPTTSTPRKETNASGRIVYAVVFITSIPSGAEIYLENEYLGRTPFRIEVPLGDYRIRAVYGNETLQRILNVTAGKEYTVSFRFSGGTPTPSSSSTEGHGSICGPAFFILAIMAVLLRRG